MRIPFYWLCVVGKGECLEVVSQRSVSENMLGFLSLDCQSHPFVLRDAIDADCFDTFSRLFEKETLVVIDNALMHISEELEDDLTARQSVDCIPIPCQRIAPN